MLSLLEKEPALHRTTWVTLICTYRPAHKAPNDFTLNYVWFCGLYLSLREEGARELRQISTGLHRLLKLTSDVILARTRDSLMGSRKQEMYSKYNAI